MWHTTRVIHYKFCTMEQERIQTRELVNRLSRIEGQVRALRRSVQDDMVKTDCIKTLSQVKAVTNALKHFGEAFAHASIRQCFAESMTKERLALRVEDIIRSTFSMS